MNRVLPDPTALDIGSTEHLGLCLSIAYESALRTVRKGTLVRDAADDGFWLDVAPLLDVEFVARDIVERTRQHIAVAVFAHLVERRPGQPLQLRIVAPIAAQDQVPA